MVISLKLVGHGKLMMLQRKVTVPIGIFVIAVLGDVESIITAFPETIAH